MDGGSVVAGSSLRAPLVPLPGASKTARRASGFGQFFYNLKVICIENAAFWEVGLVKISWQLALSLHPYPAATIFKPLDGCFLR